MLTGLLDLNSLLMTCVLYILFYQVRLSLPPLLKIYSEAIKFGDSSLSITFQMLGNFISTMDRSSISAYYLNIFDMCLLALDLRRQHPASIKSITAVEKDVINAMVVLTMKLTENMFKPLFIRCVEWSEYVDQSQDLEHANIYRAISFFNLIQKLVDSHRWVETYYFNFFTRTSYVSYRVNSNIHVFLKSKKG